MEFKNLEQILNIEIYKCSYLNYNWYLNKRMEWNMESEQGA